MKKLVFILLLLTGVATVPITPLEKFNASQISSKTTDLKNSTNTDGHEIDNSANESVLDDNSIQRCSNDSKAIAKARNSGIVLLHCMSRSNDLTRDFFSGIEHHSTVDNSKVAEFCRSLLSSMHNCTQELEDSLRPCLSESDIQAVQFYNSLPRAALSYVCAEGGQRITEVTIHHNTTCLENQMENLDPCGLSILQEARRLDKTMLALPRFLQSQNGCRLFNQGATCVTRAFLQCQETDVSGLLIGAINATVSVLPSCPDTRIKRTAEVFENLMFKYT